MKNTAVLLVIYLYPFIAICQWSNPDSQNRIYYNNGNVGIGTATPEAKLEVAGIARFTALNGFSIGSDPSRLRIQTSTEILNHAFAFLNSSNSFEGIRVRQISVGGNFATTYAAPLNGMIVEGDVGIGTTSPSNSQGWNRVLDLRGNLHAKLLVTTNNAEYKTGIFSHVSSWYGGGGFIGTESNHKLHFITNYIPKMTLDVNGNFGIGTIAPNGKLNIYNSAVFNVNEAAVGQDHIVFRSEDPGNGGYFGGITWESASRRRASIVATREHSDSDYVGLAFFTQGVDGPGPIAESMRITRWGNVGIGTTNPDAKLAVKGSIHAQEVRVDLNGSIAPDYVFQKDYELMPLSDVEKFIMQNKHLPEIPSAKSMEEEGLHLREINLLLLKKVEELTLHLIAHEKTNIALTEQVEELQNEVRELKARR